MSLFVCRATVAAGIYTDSHTLSVLDALPNLWATSPPRTLSAQAIESSAESTTASAFFAASQSAISCRFCAEDLPAATSGWTVSLASDGWGRSAQTASIGLLSTATKIGRAHV